MYYHDTYAICRAATPPVGKHWWIYMSTLVFIELSKGTFWLHSVHCMHWHPKRIPKMSTVSSLTRFIDGDAWYIREQLRKRVANNDLFRHRYEIIVLSLSNAVCTLFLYYRRWVIFWDEPSSRKLLTDLVFLRLIDRYVYTWFEIDNKYIFSIFSFETNYFSV